MTTTTMRLDALEARSAKFERDLGHMRESDAAQVRNLDRINDKLDIEPPQPLEVTK